MDYKESPKELFELEYSKIIKLYHKDPPKIDKEKAISDIEKIINKRFFNKFKLYVVGRSEWSGLMEFCQSSDGDCIVHDVYEVYEPGEIVVKRTFF